MGFENAGDSSRPGLREGEELLRGQPTVMTMIMVMTGPMRITMTKQTTVRRKTRRISWAGSLCRQGQLSPTSHK